MVVLENGSRYEHDSTELTLTPAEWGRLKRNKSGITLYDGYGGQTFVVRVMTAREISGFKREGAY